MAFNFYYSYLTECCVQHLSTLVSERQLQKHFLLIKAKFIPAECAKRVIF